MKLDIDIAQHIGAIARVVGTREVDGRQARVIVATRTYDTTIDDLWDALTSADRIPRWFLPISGDLRLGGRYQLVGNAGGEITRCEPPRQLGLTWEYGSDVSWVTVRLDEQAGDRTRLELEHVAHVPDDRWDQYGPGAVGVGWDGALMGLANHLDSGESVDPQEAMEWMMSEQGKGFYRRSSDEWCRASIAAGAHEEAARAAAARTAAFYTGEGDGQAADEPAG
ncbi:MAG TPA: SRPBCC family protein [Longimicrobium sp.]|nr:SRPBCC family protein [Longimicrobium sp.]